MFKRIIYLAGIGLCATVVLGNTQCQSNHDGVGPDGPLFVTTLAVKDVNGNAADSFASGEQIQLVLSVRNRSNSTQNLSFSGCQQTNFVVLDNGTATEVWTWAAGQVFCQTAGSLSWQPDETKTFTVDWNQTNDAGQLVSTGNYEAIGGLTCANNSNSTTSADNCMPAGIPGSGDLSPSVYVSTLVPFTIH